MAKCDILVIGGSAGPIEALQVFLGQVPGNFSASIFLVLQISPWRDGALDRVICRAEHLRCTQARDSQPKNDPIRKKLDRLAKTADQHASTIGNMIEAFESEQELD